MYRGLVNCCRAERRKYLSPVHLIYEKYFPLQPTQYWINFRGLNIDCLWVSALILPLGAAHSGSAFLSHAGVISWCTSTPLPASHSTPDMVLGKKCVLFYISPHAYVCPLPATSFSFQSHKALIHNPEPNRMLLPPPPPPPVLFFVTAPGDTSTDYNSIMCPQLLSLTHRRHSDLFFLNE